jgi:hypothetical protein
MAKATTTQSTSKKARAAKAAPQAAKAAKDFATDMSSEAFTTMNEAVTSSISLMREIGERNYGFMSRSLEQGIETRDAMMDLKDVREVVELQSTFAKTMFSAYTQEVTAQAALVTDAFRDTVKPLQKHMMASFEKFQPAR